MRDGQEEDKSSEEGDSGNEVEDLLWAAQVSTALWLVNRFLDTRLWARGGGGGALGGFLDCTSTREEVCVSIYSLGGQTVVVVVPLRQLKSGLYAKFKV